MPKRTSSRDHFVNINGVWINVRFMSHDAKLAYLGYRPRPKAK